ncbi:L-rhamnose/proton symporter RhaT [Acidicapsa ligni]|uniref:L-rhamnose/proton symporter RhaT n=1 Tax=Acidicapsa ligni TaxID=542300 RepID=UPI0021DFE9E4|nr:L-rhamnose/proton symporter RhaT [Acidicapsa ligni]
MVPNPILGVLLHWLGGLAAGSFYVPFRKVKGWSWETYWLVAGVMSWIIAPVLLAGLLTKDLFAVLHEAPGATIWWAYFFGALWGLGGLTFGLAMRYLGLSLGMAVALGYTAVFGTLIPPIFRGQFHALLEQRSGIVILIGIGICMLGILFAGAAGVSKDRELSPEQQKADVPEFNLKLGLAVATFAGIMSACFAFGLAAGDPIKLLTLQHGTSIMWQGLPVLIVVLAGGFTTNCIWCAALSLRNRTYGEYLQVPVGRTQTASIFKNYLFSAIAGFTWYLQFFFYTMGETQMGKKYGFSSWTLHMASIIIFSTLWGIALHEWRGVGRRTKVLVFLTLLVLVSSTAVVGYGNLLSTR